MSLVEIEFMKTNEKFIKYEDEHKLEFDEESTGDICTDDSYTAKCGEIFVSNSGKFSFLCAFCDDRFGSIKYFVEHMHGDHLNTQENDEDPLIVEDDVDIKSELSSEDDVGSVASDADDLEDNTHIRADTDYLKDFRAFLDKTLYDNNGPDGDENARDDFGTPVKSSTSAPSKREKNADPNFYCEICKRQYSTKSTFEQHKSKHEEQYCTEESYDTFGGSNSDEEPRERKVKIIRNPYECAYCQHQFKDRSTRISHERIHTGEKPFKCEQCGKCFRTKRLLGNHVMIHTGERPYKCEYCGSAFTHKMNMIVHVRAHLGDKRFTCDYCDKKFVRNVDRRIHMRIHTGEKPYQCEWCGTSFSTSSKLTEHRKRHTNTRPFKCEQCDKSFYSKELLKNHSVCHSTERPFLCTICFSSFPRKRALQSHVKIHSDVKEYVCGICDKAFAQNAGLYCHMKSHGVRMSKKSPSDYEEEVLSVG